MSDLEQLNSYVERLMRTTSDDGAFLIITVGGTEDFLQLVGDARGVQLDFPLVTGRQFGFESTFKAVAQRENLTVDETKEGESRFLNIELPVDPAEVSRLTKVFLQDVFRVNESTILEFEVEGIA